MYTGRGPVCGMITRLAGGCGDPLGGDAGPLAAGTALTGAPDAGFCSAIGGVAGAFSGAGVCVTATSATVACTDTFGGATGGGTAGVCGAATTGFAGAGG